jgi:peroxiredoxin
MSKISVTPLVAAFSWILIFILLVCNGFLIRQNWQLRSDIEQLSREQRVQVGENFSDFVALDSENRPVPINSEAKIKKVIFLFSTSCPYCKKQNAYWIDCLKQIDRSKYKVIALFNEREERQKVAEYLDKHGYSEADSPLKLLFSPDDTLQKYKLRSTPITLVLDENSVVEKVWLGLWDQPKITEANAFFKVSIQHKDNDSTKATL